MQLEEFLELLNSSPDKLDFNDTMAVIDSLYEFTPTEFKNGGQINAAGENNGSCKLFAFASVHNLNKQQTLNCFGQYYRDDVLSDPDGDNHQNIRNFMQYGWDGIEFSAIALAQR